MLKRFLLAGATVLVLSAAGPAFASGGVNLGSLSCRVASGVSFIFGSSREMNCVFTHADGQTETYHGSISRYGLDIGFVSSADIIWGVFAPTGNVASGSLVGTYLGGSADVTLGVGLGANALIGGSSKTISLQPLSLEGNTGLNIAGGIGEIELTR